MGLSVFVGIRASRHVGYTGGVVMLAALTVPTGCAVREYHVRGTVMAVNSTHIEVKHKSGQVVAIAVRPTTVYRWDRTPASARDLEVGARVMVLFAERRGPFAATEVRIFTRPSLAPRRNPRPLSPVGRTAPVAFEE